MNRIMSCAHKALVKENIHSPNTDRPSDLPHQAEGNIGHQLPPLDDRRADGSFRDTTLSGDDAASQEASDATPRQQLANVDACRASTEEPAVERLVTVSKESSTRPLAKPFRLATKPGHAPSAALGQLGFEPVNMVCTAVCFPSCLIGSTAGACSRASGYTLQRIQCSPTLSTGH